MATGETAKVQLNREVFHNLSALPRLIQWTCVKIGSDEELGEESFPKLVGIELGSSFTFIIRHQSIEILTLKNVSKTNYIQSSGINDMGSD